MPDPKDHNQDGPDRDVFLRHLSIALQDNADMQRIKDRRAENRKRAKKIGGIDLPDLDLAIKMSDWTPSEIANYFARKFAYLGHMDIQVGDQFDLFGGVTGKVKQAPSFKPAGLFAGLKGEAGTPPQNLGQGEQQEWLEGFHEGTRLKSEGAELAARRMADAVAGAEGGGEPADPNQIDVEEAIKEGAQESGDDLKPGELDPDEDVLTFGLASFDAERLEDCSLDNYLGPQETLEKARRIVVKDGGEERVLKDRAGAADAAPAAAEPEAAPVKKPSRKKAPTA